MSKTFRRTAVGIVTALALATTLTASSLTPRAPRDGDGDEIGLVGFAGRGVDSTKPKLTASFPRESYAPGMTAQLEIADTAPAVSIRVYRASGETTPSQAHDVMLGSPVTHLRPIGTVRGRRIVRIRIGDWPSGVYFARLQAGARVGYAPFVLRPRRLGEHPVAIVLPTQTWQAYNFRDDDGDGRPDTWYAEGRTARLGRPFLNRGVPPHFKHYDAPFLHWAVATGHDADYLADADIDASNGVQLRRAYELMIFEGHHEYVTTREYDAVTRFRDLGGNLMFLSANNFFWQIRKHGSLMERTYKWRDLDRPEAALIGAEYRANNRGEHSRPWTVTNAAGAPWLFEGTGLRDGSRFGRGGIEIDDRDVSSPAATVVVAAIREALGNPRLRASMTYYETPAGAKVFAVGAFRFIRDPHGPEIERMLANLWDRLSAD